MKNFNEFVANGNFMIIPYLFKVYIFKEANRKHQQEH